MRPAGRPGALAGLAALAMVAVVLAGCMDSGAPSAAPTATPAPEATPVTTRYELGTTVWYEGLQLRFDRVTATLDQRGGPAEVVLRVDNTTDADSDLDGRIALVVGGTRVQPTRESTVPTVLANRSVAVTLRFELQGVPSIDAAVIEVGENPLHIARVPLTPAAGTPVVFEPIALELTGAATAGDLKITLRTGLLRWDLPDWSQELDAGHQVLTLTYNVTYAGTFAGGFAFTGVNVVLRLPDGTVLGARHDGHSQSVELVGPKKTKKDLFSRFEIPAGVTGKFALLVRNGSTEKAISFTIGG